MSFALSLHESSAVFVSIFVLSCCASHHVLGDGDIDSANLVAHSLSALDACLSDPSGQAGNHVD